MVAAAVIFFSLFPCVVTAQGGEDASVSEEKKSQILASIVKGASEVKTLSSDFVQERRTSMLKEPLVATGRFFFESPERLRWEFLKPFSSGFSIDGERTRRWREKPEEWQPFDIGKEPALKATVGQIFAWARGDVSWIEKRYRMTVGSEEPLTIILVPRFPEERKYILHIALSFSPDLASIRSVEIRERHGDSTLIRFISPVINTPLPESLF